MTRKEYIIIIVIIIILSLVGISMIDMNSSCKERGGILVRGLFWFDCVRSIK